MSFSITSNPSNQELAEAINYLLANFAQTMAINPNTGNITTVNYGVVSYLYKYLQIKYADSYDGSVNLSNVPTNRLYYGIRNNDSSTESTNPADYLWLPVTGGFGTTKFVWYATTGGRQIELFIGSIPPSVNFFKDNGNAIDLDLLTIAAEDRNDPVPTDHSSQIQALEQAIGSIPQPQLGTMAPQNAENVAITGGAINGTPIGATTPSTGSFSSLTLGSPLAVTYGGTGVSTATANYVFAGPTSGGAAAPTFRALVVADIPALPYGTGNVVGPASATNHAIARYDGTTGKLIQNSVITIDDTGNTSGILSQQFSNGSAVTLAAGKMWYDGSTGSWNLGMGNGNITQQVGEEIFVYGKASAAITDSPLQIVYHTGVVGASGVIKFAPTIAGITDVNAIVGIATESLALNDFGRVTSFGVVRGITTNGTAFGEAWADDDVIWYNPITGNPTKVEPVAPYIKVQVGLVIKAGSGGSGSFQVGIVRGSKLGGTDSNVQFGTLANGDLIQYNTALGYWTNVTTASVIASLGGAPVTKTANFTVAASETWLINNKSGSTCTVTLPSPATYTGRTLTFKNMQAQTLVSASSNVVPIDSTTAGTAILLDVIGNWATMVSDGTNWVIMQAAANNSLLLE